MKKFSLIASAILLLVFITGCLGNAQNGTETMQRETIFEVASTEPHSVASVETPIETPAEPTDEYGYGETPATEEPDYDPAPSAADATPSAINIRIDVKCPELLDTFAQVAYVFDFLPAFAAYQGTTVEDYPWIPDDWGIIIWADEPMYNLQIVAIDHDFDAEITTTFVSHVFHETDVILPGTPLLLSRFIIVGGIMPSEGISFIDSNGAKRYFAIWDNRIDDDPPYFMIEFENYGVIFPVAG